MKQVLLVALAALPLVACGGAGEGEGSVDENVGTSQSEIANPYPSSYVINFDRDASGNPVADGTIVDAMYTGSFGVTFSAISCAPGLGCSNGHAFARTSTSPASVPNIVSQNASSLPFFNARYGALRADFATPRSWVSIDVMPVLTAADWIVPPAAQPWFEAYDANDNLVGKVYYPVAFGATNWGTYQTLRLDAGSATIKWVRFSVQSSGSNTAEVFGDFDNLRFNSNVVRLCPSRFGC
jgi:hypothetical protein